jgi:hypothetical protein|tara:strand:- start:426 stop:617 length:192 start_codon:yes stop_codon:yes gene_type:complete
MKNYKHPNMKTVAESMPLKNKNSVLSTASVVVPGPVVKQNLGSGPKGQRSKMQIKKVPFKGVF